MNIPNTLNGCWSQLSRDKQESILHVFHDRLVPYIFIKDYSRVASTCSRWKEVLMSNYYQTTLREIHLMSSFLFRRFVSTAKTIDRTANAKFYIRVVPIGYAGGFGTAVVAGSPLNCANGKVPQSQKDYEIQALKIARNDRFKNPIISFDNMNNEDRNNLLDAVNEIHLTTLMTSHEINEMPIERLIESHSWMKKQNPKLEATLLQTNFFALKDRSSNAISPSGILLTELILILFLTIIFYLLLATR